MKLNANGWARNHGAISLLSSDFEKVKKKEGISADEISIKETESGVLIFWGEEYVQLNGKYIFQLEFTKKDIARIFVETFSKESIEDVISLLHEAKNK